MKQFACGAVVPGCKAVFRASNDDGILSLVAEHAHRDHGLESVPAELVAAVRNKIVAVPA
jgi:predicted small metal-binding protein